MDGKRVELAVWHDCARAFVGPNTDEASDVLRQLQQKMEQCYEDVSTVRPDEDEEPEAEAG